LDPVTCGYQWDDETVIGDVDNLKRLLPDAKLDCAVRVCRAVTEQTSIAPDDADHPSVHR
jgi:hypothetical protein